MIPYRKDDWRFVTDQQHGTYFAQRGYVFCRVDVRGTGSSQGLALDEYTPQETQDGYDVVEWRRAELVQWQRRHVGHLVWRLHVDSSGDAATAAFESDYSDVRDR